MCKWMRLCMRPHPKLPANPNGAPLSALILLSVFFARIVCTSTRNAEHFAHVDPSLSTAIVCHCFKVSVDYDKYHRGMAAKTMLAEEVAAVNLWSILLYLAGSIDFALEARYICERFAMRLYRFLPFPFRHLSECMERPRIDVETIDSGRKLSALACVAGCYLNTTCNF